MKRLTCFLFLIFLSDAGFLRADPASEKMRERLNKIFYWQMADELGLKPGPEKDMSFVLENIQKRREAALIERDAALAGLGALTKDVDVKSATAPLERYQKALMDLSTLDEEEYRRLKIAIGIEKLARFYVVREAILDKLRGTLKSETAKK